MAYCSHTGDHTGPIVEAGSQSFVDVGAASGARNGTEEGSAWTCSAACWQEAYWAFQASMAQAEGCDSAEVSWDTCFGVTVGTKEPCHGLVRFGTGC
jgi:hypothetical protein